MLNSISIEGTRIKGSVQLLINCFGSEFNIAECYKKSDKNKTERIYLVYDVENFMHKGDIVDYTSYGAKRRGGQGHLVVLNIIGIKHGMIYEMEDIYTVNEKQRLSVWKLSQKYN